MEPHMLTARNQIQTREVKQNRLKKYLQTRVMPLLGPLQHAILTYQPPDLPSFCLARLKQNKHSEYLNSQSKQPDNEEIPEQLFREQVRNKIRKQRKGSRQGIIGDRPKQGFLTVGKSYLARQINDHSQQDKVKLIMYLKKCMFFQHLNNQQLIEIVKRMQEVKFQARDVIIKEGEAGNELFVVESGVLKCEKQSRAEILRQYSRGEIFGELSLLYNNPRASTVTAIEGGRLFSLSRQYFSAILHLGVNSKLHECETLVNKIDIFDSLNIYEKTKLFESMQLKTVTPQKYIIKEGQQGTCFYIVAEGQLVAYKQRGNENKLVYAYKRGDYFGEVALLRNLPRQASVKTVTDVRLYFINAEAFSRVLGPLQTILRRNQERYTKWATQIGE